MAIALGRGGIRAVLLAFVLGLACLPTAGARQAVNAGDVALFRSETYGHAFFYDGSRWSLVAADANEDAEAAVFTDGDIVVRVYAVRLPALSVRDCLDAYLDDVLPGDDGIVAVAPLPSPYPDQPAIATDGATSASADVVVTLAADDPRGKAVVRASCREVVPNESMLITAVEVPGRSWNAGRTFDEVDDPPGVGLSLVPWLVWYQPGLESQAETTTRSGWFRPIVDATGELQGVIGRNAPPCPEPAEVYEFVRAAADGPGLVLDSDAFVAIDRGLSGNGALAGDRVDPLAIEWLSPEPAADGTLALGPGDLALARIALPDFGSDMFYLPDGGPRVFLGARTGGCGGGGGAAPVRIDME